MSKLYIVGTPIGNLEDISVRAKSILEKVDIIACEDTRVTGKLLHLLKIFNKKMLPYHDKNEKHSSKGLLQLLQQQKTVALVSDAGMPVISDPGFLIVREAILNKIPLEVIPGPSAVLSTVILSSFNTNFTFHGFLKPKINKRKKQLQNLALGTHVFFVSPYKVLNTLKEMQIIHGDINVFLARELTKKFETHYRGKISEVIDQVKLKQKGEFSLAIELKN